MKKVKQNMNKQPGKRRNVSRTQPAKGLAGPKAMRRCKVRPIKEILRWAEEFEDVIWYDRKLVLQQSLRDGTQTITPEVKKGMLAGMRELEEKYGKKRLRSYYKDDFGWGMLNGKLSALRWVLGRDWDMLDT
jgi:hypothetical protein